MNNHEYKEHNTPNGRNSNQTKVIKVDNLIKIKIKLIFKKDIKMKFLKEKKIK